MSRLDRVSASRELGFLVLVGETFQKSRHVPWREISFRFGKEGMKKGE